VRSCIGGVGNLPRAIASMNVTNSLFIIIYKFKMASSFRLLGERSWTIKKQPLEPPSSISVIRDRDYISVLRVKLYILEVNTRSDGLLIKLTIPPQSPGDLILRMLPNSGSKMEQSRLSIGRSKRKHPELKKRKKMWWLNSCN